MRPIDADALKEKKVYSHERHEKIVPVAEIDWSPTIDVIPVDWMLQRMNETASGAGLNVELNNALYTVGVEWERWKKEHADDA